MAILIVGRAPRMLVERYKRQTIDFPMELLPDHSLIRSLVDKFEGLALKTSSRIFLSARLSWYWPVEYCTTWDPLPRRCWRTGTTMASWSS